MTAEFTGSGFTATAATLTNSNALQGVSFSTWGDPDRQKINAVGNTANLMIHLRGAL